MIDNLGNAISFVIPIKQFIFQGIIAQHIVKLLNIRSRYFRKYQRRSYSFGKIVDCPFNKRMLIYSVQI